MANGIYIDNAASPRSLSLDGVEVAQGGGANSAGLYSVSGDLYLDGNKIAEGEDNNGLLIKDGDLYFGGVEVGGDTPTPPTPVESDLWIPPTQEAGALDKYNYQTLLQAYDGLMSSNYPGTIKKYEYKETQTGTETLTASGGGDHVVPVYGHSFTEVAAGAYNTGGDVADLSYPLYHYVFSPASYSKTYVLQAAVHGNEKDSAQTLFRIMDIICNHCNEAGYSRLAQLRDNVRFIVIPCVSPVGYNESGIRVPATDWSGQSISLNLNRNYDVVQQVGIDSGNGGNYPFQRSEIRHVKAVIEKFGAQNIDYFVDYHDGGDVYRHFWWNYCMDGDNGPMARKLLADQTAYEEQLIAQGGTDYRRFDAEGADEDGWVHPDVIDCFGYSTGIASSWGNVTMGIPTSVCEYIGGYFGYTFNAEQMTRSLRFRANLLIYAYEMINTKGWTINEAADADYFSWDYPPSMTRIGLRKDGTSSTEDVQKVSQPQVYSRWDKLAAANPSYITKSAKLGENSSGDSIYCYTLGNGAKKVLFIGGAMRWDEDHKETEMGMYMLAEWLTTPYLLNQSAFLQRIKNDYTIVVLPCIDINAAGYSPWLRQDPSLNAGWNSSFIKWPTTAQGVVSAATSFDDVNVFLSWFNSYSQGALAILSGGEVKTLHENTGYTDEFMTQFVMPHAITEPQWLVDYCDWLENERGEATPSVAFTKSPSGSAYGSTFADYAYQESHIPTYFVNLKVSQKWAERSQYADTGDNADKYLYRNYETGRRVANIVNIILMAGGDIAAGGGLINNE